MSTEATSITGYISRVLDSSKLLIKSEVMHLSSINEEDISFLKQHWQDADIKRQRKLIANMVALSQKYLYLDFSRIFLFCLRDTDAIVRAQAVSGLADEEDSSLTETFVDLLRDDRSSDVRIAATVALGKLAIQGELGKLPVEQKARVYSSLLMALDKKGESIKVRAKALEAIAPLNLPRIKGLIEEAYQSDDQEFKISAINSMGLNCNRMWLAPLLLELKNVNDSMRHAAVKALGELGEEDAALYLVDILEDENPEIQEEAVHALGAIGGEEARNLLSNLLKDPEMRIRRAAKSALQESDFCEEPLSSDL